MDTKETTPGQGESRNVTEQPFIPTAKGYLYSVASGASGLMLACQDEANIIRQKMRFICDFSEFKKEDLSSAELIFTDILHDFDALIEAMDEARRRLEVAQ